MDENNNLHNKNKLSKISPHNHKDISRRGFIKKGLQLGGAALISSTLGCQGSWYDGFDIPANEALVLEALGSFRLFRVNLITGATSLITTFANTCQAIRMLDKNTAIVTDAVSTATLYKVNLPDNSVKTLIANPIGTNISSLAVENQSSVLLGGNLNTLYRINLASLNVTTVASGFASTDIIGIAIENSGSALVRVHNNDLIYRVNLTGGSIAFLGNLLATNTRGKIALVPNRNILLVSDNTAPIAVPTGIARFDLSSGTLLSNIGFDGAGSGLALESSNSVLTGFLGTGGLWRVNLDTGATSRVDDGTLNGIDLTSIAVRFQ